MSGATRAVPRTCACCAACRCSRRCPGPSSSGWPAPSSGPRTRPGPPSCAKAKPASASTSSRRAALAVQVGGREVRRLGPGDGFGEIALLRDVPRTATVIAVDDVALLGIDRRPFIEALGGQARSRTIAAGLVEDRLAGDSLRG